MQQGPRVFWRTAVREVLASDVKRQYAMDRATERRMQSASRSRITHDGVSSNLFPVAAVRGAKVYVYDLNAFTTNPESAVFIPPRKRRETRVDSKRRTHGRSNARDDEERYLSGIKSGSENAARSQPRAELRVRPNAAWAAFTRHFRRCSILASGMNQPSTRAVGRAPGPIPCVFLQHCLYTPVPLPEHALQVPPEFHDVGWTRCALESRGCRSYDSLPPHILQPLVNKIIIESALYHGMGNTGMGVARESNGKLVLSDTGISCSGVRVFKGTTAHALFVDASQMEPLEWDEADALGGAEEGNTGVGCSTADTDSLPAAISTLPAGEFVAAPVDVDGLPHSQLGAKHHEFAVPDGSSEQPPAAATRRTRKSKSAAAQVTEAVATGPIRCRVTKFVRTFTYKEVPVETYQITDNSGTFALSLWNVKRPHALQLGSVLEVEKCNIRIMANGVRLLELTEGTSVYRIVSAASPASVSGAKPGLSVSAAAIHQSALGEVRRKRKGLQTDGAVQDSSASDGGDGMNTQLRDEECTLCIRIDTKGTLAAEQSLWYDVSQRFGSGPYEEATQKSISDMVNRTPVVVAPTLHQSVVRLTRFNVSVADVPADAALRSIPQVDPNQPFALLLNGDLMPLQLLHCCFDPSVRAWSDIGVSTLSLIPARRGEVLNRVRNLLSDGVARWGLRMQPKPLATKAVSLLSVPESSKNSSKDGAAKPYAQRPTEKRFPTTIAVVAIAKSRATEGEREALISTATSVARNFKTTLLTTVADEPGCVVYAVNNLCDMQRNALRDESSAVIAITMDRDTKASWWLTAELLSRGILPLIVPPARSAKMQQLFVSNIRLRLWRKMESDPLRTVNVARELPLLQSKRVAVFGIDTCHTLTHSTSCICVIIIAEGRSRIASSFWSQSERGKEVENVTKFFKRAIDDVEKMYGGLDEVVVFQDGDVFSELLAMRQQVPRHCGFTFMCLHKRTDIRFLLQGAGPDQKPSNIVKGTVIPALTTVSQLSQVVSPSFFLQNHNCSMSTARTVQYTVHSLSDALDVSQVQRLSFVLAHAMATQATKLPLPTRYAHKLAFTVEKLLSVAPSLSSSMIPVSLSSRCWFM